MGSTKLRLSWVSITLLHSTQPPAAAQQEELQALAARLGFELLTSFPPESPNVSYCLLAEGEALEPVTAHALLLGAPAVDAAWVRQLASRRAWDALPACSAPQQLLLPSGGDTKVRAAPAASCGHAAAFFVRRLFVPPTQAPASCCRSLRPALPPIRVMHLPAGGAFAPTHLEAPFIRPAARLVPAGGPVLPPGEPRRLGARRPSSERRCPRRLATQPASHTAMTAPVGACLPAAG